jgi:hypothetical protein
MPDDPKKPPTLRGVDGDTNKKRPRARKARLLKINGPSGTMRDGKIIFETGGTMFPSYTVHFSVAVAEMLRFVKQLSTHLEESMDRPDDAFIDTALEVVIESRIVEGQNPHLTGSVQVIPRFRRVRTEESEE